MRLYRIGLGGGLFVCAALAAGCGGPVHVEGKVVRDGKPLAGATVIFLPSGRRAAPSRRAAFASRTLKKRASSRASTSSQFPRGSGRRG